MALSDMLAACILAIFSLAGLEKLHSSMAQVATVSLQPHWQPICAPTRRTSTEGFSAAVSARARGQKDKARMKSRAGLRAPRRLRACPTLFWDVGIFSGNPDHFGAGVLHLDFAGDETH